MEKKQFRSVIRLVLTFVLGVGVGMLIRFHGSNSLPSQNSTGLEQFDMVYQTISDNWLDAAGQEDLDLETAAIAGFIDRLGDPHTAYLSNEELESFTSAVDGSFAGIGVTYSMGHEGGVISAVIPDSPAAKAGILPGDILIAVDDQEIKDLSSDEVKALVVGEEGTAVKITVQRNREQLDFQIKRAKVDSSVSYEIRDHNIAFLDINTFGDMTTASIAKALDAFQNSKCQTIVIDLRDNTGGYLSSVTDILGLFVEEGETLFTMEDAKGDVTAYRSEEEQTYHFEHGYILVNQETASAAEVMSGVLQQLKDYRLVGKTTYGKGTAQTQFMMPDLSAVKYTYAKWLLPDGTWINNTGLTPDIEIHADGLNDFYNILFSDGEILTLDSVDAKTMEAQRMLKQLGYDVTRQDGYFDTQTQNALMAFEQDHGLTVDGSFDESDADALISALIAYYNDLSHDVWYQTCLKELGL